VPREDAATKGGRLFHEGHVEAEHAPVRCFTVRGSGSQTYTVVIGSTVESCTCPATVRCSHIYAAALSAVAVDPPPVR
jgi:uncharacterized Zn finger protein